jgi:hypothetical protein
VSSGFEGSEREAKVGSSETAQQYLQLSLGIDELKPVMESSYIHVDAPGQLSVTNSLIDCTFWKVPFWLPLASRFRF